jgi:CBS domain-containing protein
MLTAAEIMTTDLVTIAPEATVQEATDLLLERQISGLPVVDRHGRLVGVITEFALLAMVYDRDVQNQPVSRHMTPDVISVEADDPVSRVADLCIVHRVRRVPVMKDGQLVGVIARRDVLKAMFERATQRSYA